MNGCYQGSARERNFLGRGVYHDPCDTDANTVVRSGVKPEPVACLVAVITVSHEGGKMVSGFHRREDAAVDLLQCV